MFLTYELLSARRDIRLYAAMSDHSVASGSRKRKEFLLYFTTSSQLVTLSNVLCTNVFSSLPRKQKRNEELKVLQSNK